MKRFPILKSLLLFLLLASCSQSNTIVIGADLYDKNDNSYFGKVLSIEENHKFSNGLTGKGVKIQRRSNSLQSEWISYDVAQNSFSIKSPGTK